MRAVFGAMVVALVMACGGTEGSAPEAGESAEDAIRRYFEFADKGQWGPQWEELHPAHQEIVSKDKFVDCRGEFPNLDVVSFDLIETYEETVAIPGTDDPVLTTALTIELTIRAAGTESTQTETTHEISVDGQWRWALREDDLDAYREGGCP